MVVPRWSMYMCTILNSASIRREAILFRLLLHKEIPFDGPGCKAVIQQRLSLEVLNSGINLSIPLIQLLHDSLIMSACSGITAFRMDLIMAMVLPVACQVLLLFWPQVLVHVAYPPGFALPQQKEAAWIKMDFSPAPAHPVIQRHVPFLQNSLRSKTTSCM